MKKVISILLAMTLALSLAAFPALALENATVCITMVTDGDNYDFGSPITLGAEAVGFAEETISHIDLYANGDKLPGSITGDSGTMVWYAPAAGTYNLVAKANYVSGAEPAESASVSITINSKDITFISIFDTDADIEGWRRYNTIYDSTFLSEDYVMLGSKSVEIPTLDTDFAVGVYNYNNYDPQLSVALGNYDTFNMLVYNATPAEITPANYRITLWGTEGKINYRVAHNQSLTPGWQLISGTISDIGNTLTGFRFNTADYGVTNEKATLAATKLYINAVWLSKASDNKTLTSVPSIPDDQENVCNEIKKYRIDFGSNAIIGQTAENAVTVKENGTALTIGEDYNVVCGNSYIDIIFEENLSVNTEYTVVVANTIKGYPYQNYAGATYTFTTKDTNCDNAEPIPSVVYPASGATVSAKTKLAAKVIFNGSIGKVEFYEGETLLGEATARTGNEYQCDNVALTEGAHTIHAVITKTDGTPISSEAISVTALAETVYSFSGELRHGDRIIINEESSRMTSLTASVENTISKVVFKLNGEVIGEATKQPYEQEILFDTIGVNTVSADIYEVTGEKQTASMSYTTILGSEKMSFKNDYEDTTQSFNGSTYIGVGIAEDPLNSNNHMLKTEVLATKNPNTGAASQGHKTFRYMPGTTSKVEMGTAKMVYAELDVYRVNVNDNRLQVMIRKNYGDGVQTTLLDITNNGTVLAAATPYKLSFIVDCESGQYISYINGTEYARGTLVDGLKNQTFFHFYGALYNQAIGGTVYYDNFKLTSYDIDTTESYGVLHQGSDNYTNLEYTNLSGNTAEVDAMVVNTSGVGESFVRIIAVYDNNNNLLSVTTPKTINIVDNGVNYETYSVNLKYGDKQGTKVKIFTWDSMEGLKPVKGFKS
ncbi:MAG: hypothetical protein E7400_02145 [Ruminococcaceae bacterium]|nr:hypothetical protein [Oscillospiraceae bacterium]